LASIVDLSDDAIISKTLEGEITSWNAVAERRYGCSAGEIVGKSITLLIVEGSDEMVEILAKIRKDERVEHHKTRRVRKDGRAVPISLSVSPSYDKSGAIIGASSIARDITELVRTEALLRETSPYARSLLEASLDPLVTISAEGKITDVNEATTKVTAVNRADLIGTDFSDYFTEPEKAREGYRQVFAEGAVKRLSAHDPRLRRGCGRDRSGRSGGRMRR
jgi:PAS domain S-box-containing protein